MCDDDLYAVVNDPLYSSQWHLKNTATAGVDINFETRGQKFRIWKHYCRCCRSWNTVRSPDLNVHTISYDSETGTRPSKVYGTHGTNCSGFISAKTNNGIGIASIAPNCKLMSISNTLMGNPDSRRKGPMQSILPAIMRCRYFEFMGFFGQIPSHWRCYFQCVEKRTFGKGVRRCVCIRQWLSIDRWLSGKL